MNSDAVIYSLMTPGIPMAPEAKQINTDLLFTTDHVTRATGAP